MRWLLTMKVFLQVKSQFFLQRIVVVDPAPVIDDIGAVRYQKLCRELKIVPVSRIVNSLDSNVLNLKVLIQPKS